jgi:S1-C subfamily serine protease
MFRFVVPLMGALLCASSSLAAGPFGSIHLGFWNGGAYTNDATGQFSHCAATTAYGTGLNLVVSQDAGTGGWSLGFAHPAWVLNVGHAFPIDVTFDGQAELHLVGNALSDKLLGVIFPSSSLDKFRTSSLMIVTAFQQTYQLNLTSTNQLVSVISNCVAKVKATGLANAGDFSVLPTKPPVAAAPAKSTSTATAKSTSAAPAAAAAKPSKLVDVNGTGFVISSSGHILTNNHVIAECIGEIHGNLSGESAVTLRVVSKDETNDLALLQASKPFKDVAVIRGTAIHSGDSVIAIGYPLHGLLTSDFTVSTGIVNSLSGLLNDTRFLQISAPIQPGNSGGPLLDSSGGVVGIVAAKINAMKFAKATGDIPENINFAIKTGAVRDFLDNSVVSCTGARRARDRKARCRRARRRAMLDGLAELGYEVRESLNKNFSSAVREYLSQSTEFRTPNCFHITVPLKVP